jgi:hypothetical protein
MEIRGKPDELDRVAHVIGVPICRPTDRSSHDSSLEEPGFEPLVPRDTTKFSTPAHHFCLTPCTRKSRRERQPTPRGCRAPPAEPMVRILFPPAVSRTKLLGYIGYLSLAKSKAGASFGSNRPAKTVDDSGEGQVEPGLSTSAGRSSSSRGKPRRLHPSTGRFPRSAGGGHR